MNKIKYLIILIAIFLSSCSSYIEFYKPDMSDKKLDYSVAFVMEDKLIELNLKNLEYVVLDTNIIVNKYCSGSSDHWRAIYSDVDFKKLNISEEYAIRKEYGKDIAKYKSHYTNKNIYLYFNGECEPYDSVSILKYIKETKSFEKINLETGQKEKVKNIKSNNSSYCEDNDTVLSKLTDKLYTSKARLVNECVRSKVVKTIINSIRIDNKYIVFINVGLDSPAELVLYNQEKDEIQVLCRYSYGVSWGIDVAKNK